MKKILSVFAAMALSISAFSTVAMAEEGKYGDPKVTANFVQSGNYLDLELGYTGFEGFAAYVNNRGSVSGKGITGITVKISYDPDVVSYDGGQSNITVGNSSTSDAGYELAVFTFAGIESAMQSATSNAKIATLWFTLKDANFDPETSAAVFKVETVEFGVYDYATSATDADQIYGNTNKATVPVELSTFTYGTASQGGETGATEMDLGVDVTEGLYQGKTTISTPEAVLAADVATIEVSNDKSGEPQTAALPTLMGAGKTKVLTIIAFDKVAMAGSTFTIKYLNAASEAIKTFTYSVAE